MRRYSAIPALLATMIVALALSGCAGGVVKKAPGAVDELARVLGRTEPEVASLLKRTEPADTTESAASRWLSLIEKYTDPARDACKVTTKVITYVQTRPTVPPTFPREYTEELYRVSAVDDEHPEVTQLNGFAYLSLTARSPALKATADAALGQQILTVADAVC